MDVRIKDTGRLLFSPQALIARDVSRKQRILDSSCLLKDVRLGWLGSMLRING